MRKRAKWVVGIVGIVIASSAYAAEPSCEEMKAAMEVYAQVLASSRGQLEQRLAAVAVELERVKQAAAALQQQLDAAKKDQAPRP